MSYEDPDIWTDGQDRAPAEPLVAEGGPRRPPRPRGDRPRSRATAREAADGEVFEMAPESRVPRWLAALLVVGLLVVVVIGGGWWWYQAQVNPSGGPGEVVAVAIPGGTSTRGVGTILDEQGVITNATVFNFYVGGKDLTSVQAGTYEFRQNSSFDEAIEILNGGPDQPLVAVVPTLTVAEGLTTDEIVATINEQVPRFAVEEMTALLDDTKVPSAFIGGGQTSYEGLLFPATYEVSNDDTALDLLTKMAVEMEARATAAGVQDAPAQLNATYGISVEPYDVLTVASLIQEEAGNAEEAPKVAAVIYNRLKAGTPLGIDATSRYLAELEGDDLDFTSKSPYNTRINPGLPPTPIASGGEYALDAAVNPSDGPWVYYVLTEPGVHTFTESYEEFQQAKQLCIERDLGCG